MAYTSNKIKKTANEDDDDDDTNLKSISTDKTSRIYWHNQSYRPTESNAVRT